MYLDVMTFVLIMNTWLCYLSWGYDIFVIMIGSLFNLPSGYDIALDHDCMALQSTLRLW